MEKPTPEQMLRLKEDLYAKTAAEAIIGMRGGASERHIREYIASLFVIHRADVACALMQEGGKISIEGHLFSMRDEGALKTFVAEKS